MKKLLLRVTVALILVLTLAFVFESIHSPLAHATTTKMATASDLTLTPPPTPVQRDSCTGKNFAIFADYTNGYPANVDCFDGFGTLNVTIYNVGAVCGNNYSGNIVAHFNNQADVVYPIPSSSSSGHCTTFPNSVNNGILNVVTQITLY